jgi:alkaline phosphatase D
MTATRRHVVTTGLFLVSAAMAAGQALAGTQTRGPAGAVTFPQGVASGDPTPDSVVLWTRMEPVDPAVDTVPGVLEVARDEAFADLVVRADITASRASDFTVRVVVGDLEPDQRYVYRFRSGESVSQPLGRTRTAPAHDALRDIRFATVSCQNYEQGHYNSWRRMVEDDEAAAPADRLDFVLHLGDFIYEAVGYGEVRRVPPLPSGGGPGANPYAVTLEDYRHLYKVYLSDPDLIAARARFPFICTWDDHEFSNDSWQSQATYQLGGQPAQTRRMAANQAWFEFIPAALTTAPDSNGVPNPARDFTFAPVVDAPFESAAFDASTPEPNNLAAVESLRIHRAFRWGRMVDLVVTDTRSRRSAHAVPDALAVQVSGLARGFLPVSLVAHLDAGPDAGPAPAIRLLNGQPAELPPPAERPASMLGEAQRDWLLAALSASTARWRLWGNSLPLSPMRFDIHTLGVGAEPVVLTIDSWDGYPGERDAIFGHLRRQGITNVVSLTGDHHMHFAALGLQDNYAGAPVCAEFAVGGVSSQPFQTTLDKVVAADNPLRGILVFDRPVDTAAPRADAFNMTMRHGVRAVLAAAAAGSERAGVAARNPAQNPHLRHLDSRANGFARFRASAEALTAEYVTLRTVAERSTEVERRVRLSLPGWTTDAAPALVVEGVEGAPLFGAADA